MNASSYLVVLVDDDVELLELLRINLIDEFRIEAFTDPERAITFIASHPPDAVVLDMHLSGKCGLDLYGHLQSQNARPPVILLTGDEDLDLKVNCLDLGVDVYLHKPVTVKELAAHLRNRISFFRKNNPNILKLRNLELNLLNPLAILHGKQMSLTPKEFQILTLLAVNANSTVRKAKIMQTLWPEVKVEDNNIDTHMSNLRKKLKEFQGEIITMKCHGYMLQI